MAWKKTKIKNKSGKIVTAWKNEKGEISYSNPKAVRAGKEVLKVGAKGLSGIKDVASFARTALTNRGKGYKGGELIGPLPNKRLLAIQKLFREGAEERGNPGVSGGDADYGTGKEEQAVIDKRMSEIDAADKKRLSDARAAENKKISEDYKSTYDPFDARNFIPVSRTDAQFTKGGGYKSLIIDTPKGDTPKGDAKNKIVTNDSTLNPNTPKTNAKLIKDNNAEGGYIIKNPTAIQKKLLKRTGGAGFSDRDLITLMENQETNYGNRSLINIFRKKNKTSGS